MQALYQRLKEIGSDTFEKLSYEILGARYPGAGINRVDGSGGDRGVDLFSGALADGPAIWQCKHFPNGVKDIQRRQVVKSLDTAIKNFAPRRWTLMVPIDLNTGEHEWFQKLQSDYSDKTLIELFPASSFVRELIQRRNIREPEARWALARGCADHCRFSADVPRIKRWQARHHFAIRSLIQNAHCTFKQRTSRITLDLRHTTVDAKFTAVHEARVV